MAENQKVTDCQLEFLLALVVFPPVVDDGFSNDRLIRIFRSTRVDDNLGSPNRHRWIEGVDGRKGNVDQHAVKRRSAAIFGSNDDIGWFEWSAPQGIKFDNSPAFWLGVCQANPSLGITVHPDNIRAVLSDPEDIVRTEVLTQWVDTINPVINPSQWESCRVDGLRLNPEADTWLAIDLSPSRKEAALVASQRLEGDNWKSTYYIVRKADQ